MPAKYEPVTAEVIRWAIDESGYSAAEIAAHLKIDARTVEAWCKGTGRPTVGQLTKLGGKLKRPRALFFLPSAPANASLSPYLRTAAGRKHRELLPAERIQVRRARRVQRFVASIIGDEPRISIPAHGLGTTPSIAADDLRRWLGVPADAQTAWWGDARKARDAWISSFERAGILVMQLGLGTDGLRGFSLPHPAAPAIAVSTAQNDPARSFTLWHELAHLSIGSEASCLALSAENSDERRCDEIASCALIPEDELRAVHGRQTTDDRLSLIEHLAGHFGTSLRATALALIRSGLGSEGDYALVERERPVTDTGKPMAFGRGGMSRAHRRAREVGRVAVGAITDAIRSGRISELAARRVLRLDGYELVEMGDAFS